MHPKKCVLLLLFAVLPKTRAAIYQSDGMFPDPVVEIPNHHLVYLESRANVDYLSLSQQVFNLHNVARWNPKYMAYLLRKNKDYGAAKVVEKQAKKMNMMEYTPGLRAAAIDHVKEQGPLGLLGHSSADGRSPFDRISKYGKWRRIAGENIMYGPNTAIGVLGGLIRSPTHFENIYRQEFKIGGAACGPHKKYRHECVIVYAGGFEPK